MIRQGLLLDGRRGANHARAIWFAARKREGWTWEQVATEARITRARVYQIMHDACPPFREGKRPTNFRPFPERLDMGTGPRVKKSTRPKWSFPDAETLRVVAEIRAEMLSQ